MYRCPECDQEITSEAINISEGFALCGQCQKLSKLSELRESDKTQDEILAVAPDGCDWIPQAHSLTLRVSQRSIVGFFVTLGIALFWNGIVSVFVAAAAAGLYNYFVGPVPEWAPVPKNADGLIEMNDAPMGLGGCLFLCLFLTPFVCIGMGMIGAVFHSLMGYTEVHLSQRESYVAHGISRFKWRRRFDAQQVTSVQQVKRSGDSDSQPQLLIAINADTTVEFGGSLRPERKLWLQTALHDLLVSREPSNSFPRLTWLRRN